MKTGLVFIKIKSDEDVIEYLVKTLSKQLVAGRKVLWLVSGGSAIKIAVKIAEGLASSQNLTALTVTLADERYGRVGHSDSNWQQIIKAGFKLPDANLQPVLNNTSLDETVRAYESRLLGSLEKADYSVALAGMGPDGHIFGIKPHSPAVSVGQAVVGYKWDDYVRITPTLGFIKRLDEIVLYAVGQAKKAQLDRLDKDIPAADQPAQLLKQSRRVTIFNDYKGDSE